MPRDERAEQFDNFKKPAEDGGAHGLLLSIRVGGIGLTLTAATRAIICDPWWNPAVDAQAVDRMYRIGQREPVRCYRLITRNTIEEHIFNMQTLKRGVDRTTFGRSNQKRYTSADELKKLMQFVQVNAHRKMSRVGQGGASSGVGPVEVDVAQKRSQRWRFANYSTLFDGVDRSSAETAGCEDSDDEDDGCEGSDGQQQTTGGTMGSEDSDGQQEEGSMGSEDSSDRQQEESAAGAGGVGAEAGEAAGDSGGAEAGEASNDADEDGDPQQSFRPETACGAYVFENTRKIATKFDAAMRAGEAVEDRKKTMRDLWKQWHPDKNPLDAERCKSIFQWLENQKEKFLGAENR